MSSFTVGKKLYLGAGTLVVFTFALGITALLSITSIGDRVSEIVHVSVKKQTLTHEMATRGSDLTGFAKGIEVRGYMRDAGAMQTYHQQFSTTAEALQANINILMPLIDNPDAKSAAQDIQETLPVIQQAEQAILQNSMAGNMDAAVAAAINQLTPAEKRFEADTARILKVQEDKEASDDLATESSIASSRWMTGILLALACVVGVVLVFVIRQINLTLRNSVAELAESAVQISSAAGQVASSSQSLAQGASEQTATIEETSSASAEINSMARRTTESSKTTAEMVTRSQDGFEKTNKSLTEMVSAMDGINASSQKISKIIKVIDEIAFQTNILALNAAVEAARAGEAGMGFAVVADEVRNLAQRCAQAAKDTADLIEDSIQKSDGGRQKVEQVAVAIRAITADASKIKVLVDEINLGSVEQSSGIDQISRAITQMEQVTQSSAANAEESAAAAEQLNAQAEAMRDIVEGLRAMVDGGTAANRTATTHSVARKGADKSRAGNRVTPGNAQWAEM